MDFLSFPAIDFDFLWSQHLTQVAPTTTPPKQPLATQQQPQSAEITELMANYSAKMDFLRFQAIDFNFLRSQHLTQVGPTTTPTKQPLATQQQPHTEGLLQKKLKIYKVFRNSQLFDQNGIGKKLQSGCQWLLGLCCGWSNPGHVPRPYKVKIYGWKAQKVHQGHHFIQHIC